MERKTRGDIEIIKLAGSLDMHSFNELEAQVNALFHQNHYQVVLDCQKLDYIGSAAIGALIGFSKKAREQGGDVKLLNVPQRIHSIIDILGFTSVLHLCESEESAVRQFARA